MFDLVSLKYVFEVILHLFGILVITLLGLGICIGIIVVIYDVICDIHKEIRGE